MYELEEKINIKDMIYEVRGKEVMLDSDLAKLYGCTSGTKDINKAVKRNIERFLSNFYFQLTKEEYDFLKFQNGTSSLNTYGGVRKMPYVFTEQDVAMLSSVLRTKDAARVSVNIMNAFVEMRKFINENKDLFKRMLTFEDKTEYIENSLIEQKLRIDELFEKFNSEYPLLKIKYKNTFHDRFIIIDDKELYHLGASLKDLGKKVFGINKIEDTNYLKLLLDMIECL